MYWKQKESVCMNKTLMVEDTNTVHSSNTVSNGKRFNTMKKVKVTTQTSCFYTAVTLRRGESLLALLAATVGTSRTAVGCTGVACMDGNRGCDET